MFSQEGYFKCELPDIPGQDHKVVLSWRKHGYSVVCEVDSYLTSTDMAYRLREMAALLDKAEEKISMKKTRGAQMTFAKDDAFLTKDRQLAEMRDGSIAGQFNRLVAPIEKDLARDPMVHRGIGVAVKNVLKEAFSPQDYLAAEPKLKQKRVENPYKNGFLDAADEAKRKARSDRMKATWAKQREQK